jgi:hypothetical protein
MCRPRETTRSFRPALAARCGFQSSAWSGSQLIPISKWQLGEKEDSETPDWNPYVPMVIEPGRQAHTESKETQPKSYAKPPVSMR